MVVYYGCPKRTTGSRYGIYAFLGYFNVDIYDMLFKIYFAFGRVWWSRKGPKVRVVVFFSSTQVLVHLWTGPVHLQFFVSRHTASFGT